MAAGDQIVIGDVVQIGYGELTRTGYVIQSATQSRTAEVTSARDERNAIITHVISNPTITQSITMLIRDTGTITPPIVGSLISLKRPDDQYATKYILATPATVAHQVDFTVLTISVIRESSMELAYNVSATLASTAEDYDIVIQDPVAVAVTLNDASAITGIVDSYGTTLAPTTHYTFVDGTLTITAAYLNTVISAPGVIGTLTINFNIGNPATLTITGVVTP
jgi:hypothetical protein